MVSNNVSLKKTLIAEATVFIACLLFGLLLLPVVIYMVGQFIFGAYGGGGISEFYAGIHRQIRSGDFYGWFLVLSPYLLWQSLRATFLLFRMSARQP